MPKKALAEDGRKVKRKSTRRFRAVYMLSVFTDFAKVEAGLEALPWVNHDEIDFEKLAQLLAETFKYGPPVSLCVANDTIDQVTFDFRMGQFGPSVGDPAMRDFGECFKEIIPREMPSVVDVREAWRGLHWKPDRRRAPPPMMILFATEADDFEDAMIWFNQSSLVLGVELMMELLTHAEGEEFDREGRLPTALHAGLESLFGCKYKNVAYLAHVAMDEVPGWATQGMEGI